MGHQSEVARRRKRPTSTSPRVGSKHSMDMETERRHVASGSGPTTEQRLRMDQDDQGRAKQVARQSNARDNRRQQLESVRYVLAGAEKPGANQDSEEANPWSPT